MLVACPPISAASSEKLSQKLSQQLRRCNFGTFCFDAPKALPVFANCRSAFHILRRSRCIETILVSVQTYWLNFLAHHAQKYHIKLHKHLGEDGIHISLKPFLRASAFMLSYLSFFQQVWALASATLSQNGITVTMDHWTGSFTMFVFQSTTFIDAIYSLRSRYPTRSTMTPFQSHGHACSSADPWIIWYLPSHLSWFMVIYGHCQLY